MRRHHSALGSDEGMSLVELIVACVVSALLLGVIATIFGQGMSAQQQQAERDAATGRLNAISAHLNESMRNAVAARTTDSNTRIDMKVLNSAGTAFECRSWKVQNSKLWYSAGSGARGAWTTSWKTLASHIVNPASGSETVGFTTAGSSFSYILNVRDRDVEVTIRDGGYPGTKSAIGGSACW